VFQNEIILTDFECKLAAGVGLERQLQALEKGLKPGYGYEGTGWKEHIEGACGEMAAAKYLNCYWNGSFNTFRTGGDVGNLQVRTRRLHWYDLIVREADRDEDYFVLVTGVTPHFFIRGYIQAKKAKTMKECWKTVGIGKRPPAWFIPEKKLNYLPPGPAEILLKPQS